MKMIVAVVLALVALSAAAPADVKQIVEILRSNYDQKPEGGYDFGYETQDGSIRSENGELKTVNDEDNKPQTVLVVRGSFEYIDNEGNKQSITYTADENGFHPEGDSIPKPVDAVRR